VQFHAHETFRMLAGETRQFCGLAEVPCRTSGLPYAGNDLWVGARFGRPDLQPFIERPDRVGERVLAPGDSDQLAARLLIGLRPANREQDAGRPAKEVFDVERRDLTGPHRRGVADEKDRAVSFADGRGAIDLGDDLPELGQSERVGLTAWRDAHDHAQSSSHTPYDDMGCEIGQSLLPRRAALPTRQQHTAPTGSRCRCR
jgi:hypothetical protein